jgi:hypothetical protein
MQALAPKAIKRLAEIAMNPESRPDHAISAIREILNRGYGTSVASLTVGMDPNNPLSMTVTHTMTRDQLLAIASGYQPEDAIDVEFIDPEDADAEPDAGAGADNADGEPAPEDAPTP